MRHAVALLLLLCSLSSVGEPAVSPGTPTDSESTAAASAEPEQAPSTVPTTGTPESLLLAALDDGRLDPRSLRLETGGTPFLARFEAAAGRAAPRVALLIVPPSGGVVTGDRVIDALLEELPPVEHATLAVQPPLLERGAEQAAYAATREAGLERLAAGAAHLRSNGARAIAVLGIGDGAVLASAYAAQSSDIDALLTTGTWEGEPPGADLPVYELVFSHDARAGALARAREKAARGDGRPYRVTELSASGRVNADTAAAVARSVRGWLRALERAG